MTPYLRADDRVSRTVAAFAHRLQAMGAQVAPDGVGTALQALEAADVTSLEASYWALRCSLISRREDIEPFDQVFGLLQGSQLDDPDSPHGRSDSRIPSPGSDAVEPGLDTDDPGGRRNDSLKPAPPGSGEIEPTQGSRWSPHEQLRDADLAELDETDLAAAYERLTHVVRLLAMRRTRRRGRAHRGAIVDQRRTLQRALRTGGYPLERCWMQQRQTPRKLVFALDISGSMAAYANAMMVFAQATVRSPKVEAFTFATRLTRITPELRGRGTAPPVKAARQVIADWAGGTRIGENLKALNDVWGPRGVTRGAVVVVLSDGLDRGNIELLDQQLDRLVRICHALIWVNPLAGDCDYEPIARGMATALPHVDHFLPGHSLRSLETLAEALTDLTTNHTDAKESIG